MNWQKQILFFAIGSALAILLTACATPSPTSAPTIAPVGAMTAPPPFNLTSPAFADGELIPKKFSCDGEGISPTLKWNSWNSAAKSFALIVDDPDAPNGTFTHWVAFDIATTPNEIAEGAKVVGKSGLNGRRQTGYTGPCPPSGTHRYFFTLYALDIESLGLSEGAARTDVEKAMTGHLLGKAQLMGKYSR